ncbi:NUDIX domain-containing protein [Candidatus Woesebacteria bacterium]|nr:NUDIX domain-containing protein [Candidatus Woesebacteria bacterium]
MQRFKMIASIYLLLVKGGEILLLRRCNTGYGDGKYSLPAGHVEEDEPLTEALCREVKEEIAIILDPSDLRLVHAMHRREEDIRLDFFFTAKKWQGEPRNCESDKCDDLRFFPLDCLPENTISYIKAAVNAYQKGIFFSERGWSR